MNHHLFTQSRRHQIDDLVVSAVVGYRMERVGGAIAVASFSLGFWWLPVFSEWPWAFAAGFGFIMGLVYGAATTEPPGTQPRPSDPVAIGVLPNVVSEFRLVVTSDGVAYEHPKRKRESIRWAEVVCISYVTTSQGHWLPDMWLLFEGKSDGCSVPTDGVRV